jgi:hypothetical protein
MTTEERARSQERSSEHGPLWEERMQSLRLAALTVAMTLAFSGLSLARDHDDPYKDDHHKHDHYKDDHHNNDHYKDRHESNHDWDRIWNHDHNRDRIDDRWERSAREQEREREIWEREHRNTIYGNGPVYNRYPNNYPGGYGYPGGGYGYPGTVYGRGGYGGASGFGYQQGMQDGSYQARKDIAQGKPFNPNPRGSSHSDHGYNSSMGDKNSYRASYDQGYHSGYQTNYGGRGNRGWGF